MSANDLSIEELLKIVEEKKKNERAKTQLPAVISPIKDISTLRVVLKPRKVLTSSTSVESKIEEDLKKKQKNNQNEKEDAEIRAASIAKRQQDRLIRHEEPKKQKFNAKPITPKKIRTSNVLTQTKVKLSSDASTQTEVKLYTADEFNDSIFKSFRHFYIDAMDSFKDSED